MQVSNIESRLLGNTMNARTNSATWSVEKPRKPLARNIRRYDRIPWRSFGRDSMEKSDHRRDLSLRTNRQSACESRVRIIGRARVRVFVLACV